MATGISGDKISLVTQGIKVHSSSATVAADKDLFSIDGGNVLLVGLLGEVTVAIGGGSHDFAMHLDPDDGGTNVVIADAATPLAVDADATGTMYTLNTTFAGDMVATLDYAANAMLATPLVLVPGDIVLDVTGTEAGEVEWWVWYVPIDEGASITAV